MIYRYIVKRAELADDHLASLGAHDEVMSRYSPREIRALYCFDCQFPSGDVHPLTDQQVDLLSCHAYETDHASATRSVCVDESQLVQSV